MALTSKAETKGTNKDSWPQRTPWVKVKPGLGSGGQTSSPGAATLVEGIFVEAKSERFETSTRGALRSRRCSSVGVRELFGRSRGSLKCHRTELARAKDEPR